MKITVIALSHKLESWAQQALDQFTKRMPNDWKVQIKELKPEDRSRGKPTDHLLEEEAKRIARAAPKNALLVALDEKGKHLTSHEMANNLQTWHDSGEHLCLIIGSSDGLSNRLKIQCHATWRLSSLTLPHALARVLLAESLYRAWSILANHPYHRD